MKLTSGLTKSKEGPRTKRTSDWLTLPTGLRAAALLMATAVMAGACGSQDEAETDSTDGAETEAAEVVLVTYDSFALPEGAAETFQAETGATIKVVAAGDSGAMLAGSLLTAGSPDGDVIFGVDNTTATEVLDRGLLEPYAAVGLDEVRGDVALDGELGELLTPIDTGDVCLNIDTQWFADNAELDPPATFEQLTSEEYASLLVVENPVNSSPGMAFMLGTIDEFGEDGWLEYWGELKTRGVKVAPSWDDAYYNDYSVNGGDRPIVVSYASSPPAEVIFSEGERTEPASEVALDTCVAQVEYAGLLEGAANPELGQELIDFMLAEDWQSALPEANFVYPVTGVDLPESFVKWAPRPKSPIIVDAVVVGENRNTWIEQWREVME